MWPNVSSTRDELRSLRTQGVLDKELRCFLRHPPCQLPGVQHLTGQSSFLGGTRSIDNFQTDESGTLSGVHFTVTQVAQWHGNQQHLIKCYSSKPVSWVQMHKIAGDATMIPQESTGEGDVFPIHIIRICLVQFFKYDHLTTLCMSLKNNSWYLCFFSIAFKSNPAHLHYKLLLTTLHFQLFPTIQPMHIICLQCFDTVGWASGRASGL